MHHILIVEDDLENCDILSRNFDKAKGYRYTIAHDAGAALEAAKAGPVDLILLDVMLPGMDGIELCAELRRRVYCPILFISCLDDEETIVRAMRMGGDDYLTKPFRFPVLLAHMEAVLRRVNGQYARPLADVRIGRMTLSIKEHAIKREDGEVRLSPTEFELLLFFILNADRVIGFEEIYEHIWKRPSLGDLRTVFSHARNLRKKIEEDPSCPERLVTVPRTGYIFHL